MYIGWEEVGKECDPLLDNDILIQEPSFRGAKDAIRDRLDTREGKWKIKA